MRWYYAEDREYYSGKEITKLRRPNLEILVCPKEEELIKTLREGKSFDVLAPYLPPPHLKNLFVLVELPNRYGVLTTQEKEYLDSLPPQDKAIAERKIIENKLGLKITKPKIPEDKVIGLRNVKRFIWQIKTITDPKLRPKAVFLAGIPGTGKSYSAKYSASILGRHLVEFNLSKIMESPNPTFLLHSIFQYLEKLSSEGYEFILWIDEIEKMFATLEEEKEKRLLGQLLTIINELGEETGYKVNGVFFVTANDVTQIVEKNPEFLRKGRFDELFFLDVPLLSDAKKLFTLYRREYGNFGYYNTTMPQRSFEEDAIFYAMDEVYVKEKGRLGSPESGERFIYTPAEIQQMCKELAKREKENQRFLRGETEVIELLYPYSTLNKVAKFLRSEVNYEKLKKVHLERLRKSGGRLTELDLIAVLSVVEPMAITMREGLSKMYATEKYFVKAD